MLLLSGSHASMVLRLFYLLEDFEHWLTYNLPKSVFDKRRGDHSETVWTVHQPVPTSRGPVNSFLMETLMKRN
jgi:hypothetical protein